MSQQITNAFENYWQSCLTTEQPVVLDEFILADIPNLDITSPIDPDTSLPPESQIVHRQNVDQRGRINNNAVAYTIVMDTTVGDFSFNAMYLSNKQNGVIGMIVYKGRETKLKTDQTTGQTGNSLVKSMLMGYDQAAEATLTHVDAGTWQIDYAARLRGQDEDLRQLTSQLYGHHTFIGDGFKVVQQDGNHQVTPGVAIVGGLRVELKQPEVIYPGTKPIGVWVDVHRAGSLLSEHQNQFTIITSVADLTDHVDNSGYQHYVAKLGTVQADNTVVDGRGQGGSSGEGAIPDTFILWKRSMAEAGYNVVGSFDKDGVLESASDVLIHYASETAYSGSGPFPQTVNKGTNPTIAGSGYISRNSTSLRKTTSLTFKSIADIDTTILAIDDKVAVENYHINGRSGVLFFTVVEGDVGFHDGGKFIALPNGLLLRQNLKMPLDPRAWGAVGNGDRVNSSLDTAGLQGAINYGETYIRDGKYVINATTTIKSNAGVKSSQYAQLEYINDTGPCVYVYNGTQVIENGVFQMRIMDNSKGRQSSWSVVCERVATSDLCFEVIPGGDYEANYGSLTADQQVDLKFGLNVKGTSFTNSIKSKLYQSCLLLESADNEIVEPTVIWANGRRWAIKLATASTRIEGIQTVPGRDYGIYSDAADITNTQIIDNYFDGNTKLQSEIPTGHMIYFAGNLRRSNIVGNRFFIPAKRAIHVGGTLEASSISGGNFFSNGDAADQGFGDIYLGKSNGSVITGNTHFRDNLAAKTGVGRTQPPQPPIIVAAIGSDFDEPTLITANSLMGVNFYADSVYPAASAILTRNNHKRFHNKGAFVCRYSDNMELKVYQTALSQAQLDALPHGEVYTNSLADIGITTVSDPSGYIRTTRLQNSVDLAVLPYGKQEIISNGNKLYTRTLVNGIWGTFRQI